MLKIVDVSQEKTERENLCKSNYVEIRQNLK